MSLLARVTRALDVASIGWAVIGATALAAHGVSRSTADLDLLVIDPRALERENWTSLEAEGAEVERNLGDPTDPLAGVVRIRDRSSRSVDVVVGRGGWQRDVLDRAVQFELDGAAIRVVTAADLVLLKLYAGGPQDLDDVRRLLATEARDDIRRDVEERISSLPRRAVRTWREVG